MSDVRVETDSFGPLNVPADKLWGIDLKDPKLRASCKIKKAHKPSLWDDNKNLREPANPYLLS